MITSSFRIDFENLIHSEEVQDIFDMAAWCFCHYKSTLQQKKVSEASYLGRYYDENPKHPASKHNSHLLNRLQAHLIRFFSNPDPDYNWKEAVLEEVKEVQFVSYLDDVLLEETLACAIITAVDLSLSPEHNTLENGFYKERMARFLRRYPLNRHYTDKVRIFPYFYKAMHQQAKQNMNFPPSAILGKTVSNLLKNIFFLEENVISNEHRIKCLHIKLPVKHPFWESKKLRIAIAPFTNIKETTSFIKQGEGSLYTVSHNKEYDDEYAAIALKVLEHSISENANIIIFPEYMITDSIEDKIVSYLIEHKENHSDLMFVVAGSQWVTEGDCTNNVSSVYYSNGQLLGKTYKYSEYASFEIGSTIEKSTNNYTERLSNPGKEILILDIESVGRFAFAICRDVCDESGSSLTERIVRVFRPDFLIVPAWSKSIHRGFETKFKNYASQGVISILCNCCEAVDPDSIERSLVGYPVKNNMKSRHISGETMLLECTNIKEGTGCHLCSCIFFVDIDPTEKNLKQGSVCQCAKQSVLLQNTTFTAD